MELSISNAILWSGRSQLGRKEGLVLGGTDIYVDRYVGAEL